jgi:hypothetical protein
MGARSEHAAAGDERDQSNRCSTRQGGKGTRPLPWVNSNNGGSTGLLRITMSAAWRVESAHARYASKAAGSWARSWLGEKIGSGTHMVILSSIFSIAQDAPTQGEICMRPCTGLAMGNKKRHVHI